MKKFRFYIKATFILSNRLCSSSSHPIFQRNPAVMSLLTILLTISSSIGCFPVKTSLLSDPSTLQFTWTHPLAWYSLILLIFDLLITVDSRGIPTFCEIAFADRKKTKIITGYVENFNNLSSDRFIRIYAFLTCNKTIKLVQIIHELKQTLKEFRSKDEESNFWGSPNPEVTSKKRADSVKDCCDPNSAFIPKTLKSIQEELQGWSWRNLLSIKRCRVSKCYIILAINFCVHFTNHIFIFVSALKNDSFVSKQRYFFLPDHDWVIKAVFAANNVLIMTSQFFNLACVVILGQEVAELYKEFIDVLLQRLILSQEATKSIGWNADLANFRSKNQRLVDEQEFKDKYTRQFKQLKVCCQLFSDSHGFYAIVNIGSVIFSLGQFAFIFANNADIVYFSRFIACVIWIYVTIAVGDRIERQCIEASNDIQDVLMSSPSNVNVNENLREIANWVSSWSCKLTARNIFTVNMRLIPGVIGTVLTYVIFLFQLTMSEKFKW